MSFDGTVTLGALLQIAVMVIAIAVAWQKLEAKLSTFSVNLEHHAMAIEKHTMRLDAIDSRLLNVVADLQRLIGRSEAVNSFNGRTDGGKG